MRTCILAVIASLSFFSCKKEEPQTPGNGSGHPPYTCVVEAVSPRMQIWPTYEFQGITHDSIAGWLLRKYVANDSFNILLEEGGADTTYATSGFDWEVYLPAMNKSIWISNIEFIPRTDTTTCPLGWGHYTKLAGMTVIFDGDSLHSEIAPDRYDPLKLLLRD